MSISRRHLEDPGLLRIRDVRRTTAGDGVAFWSIRVRYLGSDMSFQDRFGTWLCADLPHADPFPPPPFVERALNDLVIEAVS